MHVQPIIHHQQHPGKYHFTAAAVQREHSTYRTYVYREYGHDRAKGTEDHPEKNAQAGARRRYANIYIRLEDRVRDLQPRFVSRNVRKMNAIDNNPTRVGPFVAHVWAQ